MKVTGRYSLISVILFPRSLVTLPADLVGYTFDGRTHTFPIYVLFVTLRSFIVHTFPLHYLLHALTHSLDYDTILRCHVWIFTGADFVIRYIRCLIDCVSAVVVVT